MSDRNINKTNIILSNLSQDKLTKVLEFCDNQQINFSFDKDEFQYESYEFYNILEDIILNNKKVPIVYKKLLEFSFTTWVLYSDDPTYKEKFLDKIANIEYDN